MINRVLSRSPNCNWLLPNICIYFFFLNLGKNPVLAIFYYFYRASFIYFWLSELIVKATPLIIIALGLSIGFRAGVWNIGAEGQFTIGAFWWGDILAFYPTSVFWILPLSFFIPKIWRI
ncbi:MAG: hypothetical protein CM15mP111_2990 [Hyphomicrobiales bacterium]|nr:MAG: hypothetical protein CM15mP111_2990 [Hyphomicrobiales bacterium]